MIRSLLDEAGYRSGKHPILEFEPREQFVCCLVNRMLMWYLQFLTLFIHRIMPFGLGGI